MIMYESGYYPTGAEYDPSAPWNRSDTDEAVRDIDYSCTMHRVAPVSTTDYIQGEWERDEDGFACRSDDDFSDTNWLEEYTEQYRTPEQLIKLLREIASDFADGRVPKKSASQWQRIADDCRGWEMDDEYAEEA